MAINESNREFTVLQIAEQFEGEIRGNDSLIVSGVNVLERATESDLGFIGGSRDLSRLNNTVAHVIICPHNVADSLAPHAAKTFILVDDPETVFLEVAKLLHPKRIRQWFGVSSKAIIADSAEIGPKTNIYPLAVIGEDVVIGEHCDIGPGVVIGNGCVIGDNVRIDANCVFYDGVQIGDDVSIQAGTVLGATGFGYKTVNGHHERLPHVGTVRIANDVQIGACTTIDRAKVGETFIDSGSRIDNLVMIAHNCQIGKHNLLVSQVGIAGSVSSGEYVVFAGQAGIADHVHLGDGAVIGAKTGVHRNMPGGKAYLGIPARDAALHAREQTALKRLPDMRSTVKRLEKQVALLQEQMAALQDATNSSSDARDAA